MFKRVLQAVTQGAFKGGMSRREVVQAVTQLTLEGGTALLAFFSRRGIQSGSYDQIVRGVGTAVGALGAYGVAKAVNKAMLDGRQKVSNSKLPRIAQHALELMAVACVPATDYLIGRRSNHPHVAYVVGAVSSGIIGAASYAGAKLLNARTLRGEAIPDNNTTYPLSANRNYHPRRSKLVQFTADVGRPVFNRISEVAAYADTKLLNAFSRNRPPIPNNTTAHIDLEHLSRTARTARTPRTPRTERRRETNPEQDQNEITPVHPPRPARFQGDTRIVQQPLRAKPTMPRPEQHRAKEDEVYPLSRGVYRTGGLPSPTIQNEAIAVQPFAPPQPQRSSHHGGVGTAGRHLRRSQQDGSLEARTFQMQPLIPRPQQEQSLAPPRETQQKRHRRTLQPVSQLWEQGTHITTTRPAHRSAGRVP